MVWGGICLDGRTDLVVIDGGALTVVRYRDEVLEPVVRPFAGALGQDFVLMHDNARPHTARVVQAYLEQEGIDVMGWPARAPDLHPIEHLWDILQRRVSGRQNPPATVQALTAALREEWKGINQVSVHHLIRSMPIPVVHLGHPEESSYRGHGLHYTRRPVCVRRGRWGSQSTCSP